MCSASLPAEGTPCLSLLCFGSLYYESKFIWFYGVQQVPAFRSYSSSPFETELCKETNLAWWIFLSSETHQPCTGLGLKCVAQLCWLQRTAKTKRWLTYTAVLQLSKCEEVWLSMISTPFSCNTPSCVCNVFVGASKPLVQQDPGVRKTKNPQSRNLTPWHLNLKKRSALKDFLFLLPLSLLPHIFVIPRNDRIYFFCLLLNHGTDRGFIRERFHRTAGVGKTMGL